MAKRIYIIHGWDGYPTEGWFPWIKTELEKHDFEVHVPSMPNPHKPEIESWIKHLSSVVNKVDSDTYFIGHSIGCQTILRYLESLPTNSEIGGAVFVAGWFTLINQTTEELEVAKPWLENPINFEKIKQLNTHYIALFSDNDDVVPLENETLFKEAMGAQTIIEHNQGHFSGGDGITKAPVILKAILQMSTN